MSITAALRITVSDIPQRKGCYWILGHGKHGEFKVMEGWDNLEKEDTTLEIRFGVYLYSRV